MSCITKNMFYHCVATDQALYLLNIGRVTAIHSLDHPGFIHSSLYRWAGWSEHLLNAHYLRLDFTWNNYHKCSATAFCCKIVWQYAFIISVRMNPILWLAWLAQILGFGLNMHVFNDHLVELINSLIPSLSPQPPAGGNKTFWSVPLSLK